MLSRLSLQLSLILLSFSLSVITSMAGPETRIIIDAGHGGKDEGAHWYGVRESDLNLQVAKKLEALLLARNIPVTMTRRSDVFVPLAKRAEIANSYQNAIFVSIHFNAHRMTSIHGVETFYASPAGKPIAMKIQKELVKLVETRNRFIKRGLGYAVLNKTKCPAVLVECGFISNPLERNRCKTGWYQMLAARGIAEGIIQSMSPLDQKETVKKTAKKAVVKAE